MRGAVSGQNLLKICPSENISFLPILRMEGPLLDVAMSYVKATSVTIEDPAVLQRIREAFSRVIYNGQGREELVTLLLQFIKTTQPLDRIDAILYVPSQPPPTPHKDLDMGSSIRKKTRPWAAGEDARLIAGIHRFGLDDWVSVARFVGNGRTRAQCAQRWVRGLDPRISKDQWTWEDEQKLLSLVANGENKGWTAIAAAMGNRSDVQCRYHFLQMRKEGRVGETSQFPTHDLSHARIPLPPRSPLTLSTDIFQVPDNQRVRRYSSEVFNTGMKPSAHPQDPLVSDLNSSKLIRNASSQPRLTIPCVLLEDSDSLSGFDEVPTVTQVRRQSDDFVAMRRAGEHTPFSFGTIDDDPWGYDVVF